MTTRSDLRALLECVVSWPGSTLADMAEELGLTRRQVQALAEQAVEDRLLVPYATGHRQAPVRVCRDWHRWEGWQVPENVPSRPLCPADRVIMGTALGWHEEHNGYLYPDRLVELVRYARVTVLDSLTRLRGFGLLRPAKGLHPTDAGELFVRETEEER